jgi:hypothetical protein
VQNLLNIESKKANNRLMLEGNVYGGVTVVSFAFSKSGNSYWNCKCSCGKDFIAFGSRIKNGSIYSCGCRKYEGLKNNKDYTGQKIGNLTVIKPVEKEVRMWLCRCDCGSFVKKSSKFLGKSRLPKSCGCLSKRRGINHPRWTGTDLVSGHYFCSILGNAKSRNLLVNLDIIELTNMLKEQNFKCALSGLELKPPNSPERFRGNVASLDRIDSSNGYETGNVRWIHSDINIIKQNMNSDDFIEWCHRVTEYQESKKQCLKAFLKIPKNSSCILSRPVIHSYRYENYLE